MKSARFNIDKIQGPLRIRLASTEDISAITKLQRRAIDELQRGFLSPEQIAASHAGMGLDTQLIQDGTYFCVETRDDGRLAGCGGWSRRATLYGGNHSGGRDTRRLDPGREAARIRAMYTHPDHVRRGVGRFILDTAEAAARHEGFTCLTLAATAAGKPFYAACGYAVSNRFQDTNAAVSVPLYTMDKRL